MAGELASKTTSELELPSDSKQSVTILIKDLTVFTDSIKFKRVKKQLKTAIKRLRYF